MTRSRSSAKAAANPSIASRRDHVVPYSEGGRRSGNLVLACYSCNQARKPDAQKASA